MFYLEFAKQRDEHQSKATLLHTFSLISKNLEENNPMYYFQCFFFWGVVVSFLLRHWLRLIMGKLRD